MSVVFQSDGLSLEMAVEVMFMFRMFAKAFHDPYGASIDSIILLWYDQPSTLCLFAFLLHRSKILLSKSVYMLVSVITAIKNKK